MKKDLDSREAIIKMVDWFYETVKSDPVIGYFFTDTVKVDWNKHLPVMYDFWESIILDGRNYSGNPIAVHQRLHQLSALKKEHFERWLDLFMKNLDKHFEGAKTEIARQRAISIATVMQLKINS